MSYGYDPNGNMTSRAGATITWTSGNQPATINGNGEIAEFGYAPDRSRWRQVSTYPDGTETTIYVGGLLEKLTTPERTYWKHLIATPSGQVQHVRRSDGTTQILYLPSDHLGSVDAVLNHAGTLLVRTSFGNWGGRRDDDWVGAPSAADYDQIAITTRRGFTGHEMLDNVALVHMNGRVYDPAIGRFISADPFIDGETNPQGWNRYAYVQNRPCSLMDPSGFGVRPVISWVSGPDGFTLVENVTVTANPIGFGFSLSGIPGFAGASGASEGGRAGAAGSNRGDRDGDGDDAGEAQSQDQAAIPCPGGTSRSGPNISRRNNPDLNENVQRVASVGAVTLGVVTFAAVMAMPHAALPVGVLAETGFGAMLVTAAMEPLASAFLLSGAAAAGGWGIGSIIGFQITDPVPLGCN